METLTVEAVHEDGWWVFAVELPGFGMGYTNSKKPLGSTEVQEMVSDLIATCLDVPVSDVAFEFDVQLARPRRKSLKAPRDMSCLWPFEDRMGGTTGPLGKKMRAELKKDKSARSKSESYRSRLIKETYWKRPDNKSLLHHNTLPRVPRAV